MTGVGVVTMGETMGLLSSTRNGPLQHARTMTLGIGGSESNVAIALRRLDAEATWIGRLGSDAIGDLVERELTAERVRVVAIRDAAAPTAIMLKEHRTSVDTRIWYYRRDSAGSRLSVDDVDPKLIQDARILHLTGISPALSRTFADAVFESIRVARDAGVVVSFDLNYRGALWSRDAAAETYRRIIPLADIVFAGADEAAIVAGADGDALQLAERLVGLGAGEAIIKLGSEGAVALVDGTPYRRAAVPITAIDSVGAGDAFVAGYLADYLLDEDVPTRLTTAVSAGAAACLVDGDWEGAPRREDLARLGSGDPVTR